MAYYAYLFEAKSIQSYIFATNKLKEIIGGSELIERLTANDGLLRQTLISLGFEEDADIRLSRCGGAAFYAFSENEENLKKLANLWPLVFRQYAPDMEFIHAMAEGKNAVDAFKTAHDALMADRNRPKVKLPQAGVYTLRFGRTGEPVTDCKGTGEKRECFDQITLRKRAFSNSEALAQRVMWDSHRGEWPVNLTPEEGQDGKNLPFTNDNRLVGLIHADGNGFGQLLMDLKDNVDKKIITNEQYIDVFRNISESIKTATEAAAANAVSKVLFPKMDGGLFPARPIVLGGDDLTMIVRADLALPFTQAFLKAFEQESHNQFELLRSNYPNLKGIIPERLTACAGIVYAKSSQPFSLLHDLAEGLCKHTKTIAKRSDNLLGKQVPSSLTFYRVTTSLIDDFKDILKNELTTRNICLSRGCYTLDAHDKLPNLPDLLALQVFLAKSEVSRGALRQVTGLLHQSPEQAQRRYERWKEVMQDRDQNNWNTFNELFRKLSEPKSDFDVNHKQAVPFEDVLSLSAVSNVDVLNTAEGANA
ncbi:hypothetical protein J9253_12480 [Thiothrix litoralis]|jgi:hypothetical protein|uniref:Cas10/Cmr2 second palm domain-containing protein n=1 Tax=Thiothrix litoralis TaxID=2891210 RepID=A0ABX7WT61_9GAMM|nr:hypothetical protein [Thiothrix litoralis]QTR44834.1 hypothetical protein J9253_12480 [Thiothrix litoralis]